MEKVSGRTMYHISRENHWKQGDIIFSGVSDNPFWSKCKDYSPKMSVNGQIMSLFEMFDTSINIDATKDNVDHLYNNLKTISKECAFYIREQVFEDVRKNSYTQLPSRQTSLWVTEKDQIDYWKTIITSGPRFLLRLELDGFLFCGDDYWLSADTFSSIEYTQRANHYWAAEMSDNPHKEFLFSGKALVVDVYPL